MATCIAEPPVNKSMLLKSNDNEAIRGEQAKPTREISPSPLHRCRKRSRKMMSSSPYFQTPTHTANIQEKKLRSSLYFQKSPSSTFGSIRSLGPLICTWTGCTSAKCQRKDGETATSITPNSTANQSIDLPICHVCHPIIQSAMAHFQQCQWFRKRLQAIILPQDTSLPCVVQMESMIQDAVRHLCPHQCFLKAYAPSREWVYFRKELHERTDEPIDEVLQGWTCRLVHQPQFVPNLRGNEECQEEWGKYQQANKHVDQGDDPKWESEPIGAIYPKIGFFCSKTNESYKSTLEAMRALGLEDASKKKIKTVDANDERGHVDDKGNEVQNKSCDTPAPEYPLISRIPPPFFDMSNATRRPLLSTGRRRLWREQRQRATASESLPLSVFHTANGRSPLGLLEELFIKDPWKLLVSAILLNRSRRAQVDYILWGFLEQWPTPQALLASSNAATQAHRVAGNTNDHDKLRKWIQPLGLQTRRSQGLVRFCRDYLSLLEDKRRQLKSTQIVSSQPISESQNERDMCDVEYSSDPACYLSRDEILGLYNCGEYVADAYQIFIANHAVKSNMQVDWKNLHPKDHALMAYVEWKRSVDTNGKQDRKQ